MGYTPDELYRMTLAEFLNGFYGFIQNQQFEQRQAWEQARYILSGLVSNPPSFPWDEGEEHRPYTEEEKQQILQQHKARQEKEHVKKQKLTSEGWVDVNSGPESTD